MSCIFLDLPQRCINLLQSLNLDPTSQSISSTPITIPRIVYQYATRDLTSSSTSHADLLDALSLLAAYEGLSEYVLYEFKEVALDLLARWLDVEGQGDLEWERRLALMAALGELRPDLWRITTAFIASSPLKASPLVFVDDDDLLEVDTSRLQLLLLAYVRLLTSDPSIASRNDWPIAPLHILRTKHSDSGVRLLAVQALSKQRGWSEVKRKQMERDWVGDVSVVDAEIRYGAEVVHLAQGGLEVREKRVDGWVLPILEDQRVKKYNKLASTYTTLDPGSTTVAIAETDLSARTAVIGDGLLLRSTPRAPSLAPALIHVHTAATDTTLGDIAQHIPQYTPLLITSSPSSGKTHILHYLSSQLFPAMQPTNRILTIPLADTTIDVKSLIGTYVSSPTKPGTFEWMEGALAKAVRAGRWVVFDDIDRASTEMLVTISGIARSLRPGRTGRRAVLAVPGRDDIEAGEGFGLFSTRTVRDGAVSPPTYFGHHNFTEIHLAAPSVDDILAILSARFDKLPRSVTITLVEIWREIRPFAAVGGQVKARDIGLRDLEKWCERVQRNLPPLATLAALEQAGGGPFANPVFQDEVLLEAVDTFVASLDNKASSLERRSRMVEIIADRIGMDLERAVALIDTRKPTLEIAQQSQRLHIGRSNIPIAPSERRRAPPSDRPFALTKPSLVLLERVAAAASAGEPTLLVGETGTGKTTAVQYIASTCRKPLTVLNLSMQTESSDLLGGFKPIDASVTARQLHTRWQKLFIEAFSMGKSQNGTYLEAAAKALSARKWGRCAELWAQSARRAVEKLTKADEASNLEQGSPRKKRKINGTKVIKAALQWQSLLVDIADFDLHHVKMKSKLVFSFVEGPLVKALKSGEWLLLDEINLASQETLESISTLLEGSAASLVLTERGDVEPVPRHPDFRLFACMNPATDVGKKDLPPNLRARFTELYVPPPDDDREALTTIVAGYIGDAAAGDKAVILDIVEMYSTLKRLSSNKEIVDGSNAAPHYSMRTLARALMFAVQTAPLFGLRRGLWEGCLMAFTMSLDVDSVKRAHEVCEKHILGPMRNARAVLAQIPTLPSTANPDDYIRFGPFWLKHGPLPPASESRYVITSSVQAKLADLARVILTRRYPVLIQGPTSAGKTSAVEFLARQTGHRFVRINNHEHTDIQEYLGTYVTDPQTGNLVFQEGLLVTAVREGHWIVLDELNLAPTDVLEALNRLLDDNRELVIPETQEVIRPHPNFILFATQNPPGLYAGRKVLSRAFRNRFLEVHFGDVPKNELETILCQRCQIAPSYAKRIVQVFEELRHRRQATRVFESKSSFATLRDLFRWAERGAVGYQQLAEDGYMLLAERARQDEDKVVIKQVIEEVMKVTIDERGMYTLLEKASTLERLPFGEVPDSTMVWTRAMQRLFVLVAAALKHNEPVLLVGETGCGKTSVCEVMARAFQQHLVGVNCHQNMETADLLGSQRPVRNRLERRSRVLSVLGEHGAVPENASNDDLLAYCDKLLKLPDMDTGAIRAIRQDIQRLTALFEWSDGPLVNAMMSGDLLLLDEISLADDSVLERLNSVLEPSRTLVLAEKGGSDIDSATIIAESNFHVVATMNPGGDFGKKELSPALRNRFTEIWVPSLGDREDLERIVGERLVSGLEGLGGRMLDFFEWFGVRLGDASGLGLRDILAWVSFANQLYTSGAMQASAAFHHGGQMVFIDGLESLPQVSGMSAALVTKLRTECLFRLSELTIDHTESNGPLHVDLADETVSIGAFGIRRGPLVSEDSHFRFEAPTTALNAMRVLRGCQLPKAILLEGSPGVGKTSLVAALASLSGHHLQRINLSDQTDLIDLFGSDLPVEGGKTGEFQWRDAAFLDAMQKGEWVLLDEMNLASQTVLEGLNAVLDHRGTVFIPELGRSFDRHPDFRVFAAQNPLQQGGGRKGLPKSFLNRFTKVYLQEHTPEDLMLICGNLHPMPQETVKAMIEFNEVMRDVTMVSRTIGREGSPWEFNLRDLFRWFRLIGAPNGLELSAHPAEHLRLIYLQRFRNEADHQAVKAVFQRIFNLVIDDRRAVPYVTPSWLQIGHSLIPRSSNSAPSFDHPIAHGHLDVAESVLKCVEMGWLVILSGESGTGKRKLIQGIAEAAGKDLASFAMHPGVDTSEILGSFEQQDNFKAVDAAFNTVKRALDENSDALLDCVAFYRPLSTAYKQFRLSKDTKRLNAFVDIAERILGILPESVYTKAIVSAFTILSAATASTSSGFAWSDGSLITALRTGGWFHITDANLCSPSVLDRLNSLCETDGVLVLSEKGSSAGGAPEVIEPHKDFRLFMSYDPRFGELSRAMRNRGVELHVPRSDDTPSPASSGALAEDTAMRSIVQLNVSCDTLISTKPRSSVVANTVSSQARVTVSILQRLPLEDRDMYIEALRPFGENGLHESRDPATELPRGSRTSVLKEVPFDLAMNPYLKSDGGHVTFRLLQLHLRNDTRQKELSVWLSDPMNSKTVLAVSSRGSKPGRRSQKAAGNEVWPLISLYRHCLADIRAQHAQALASEDMTSFEHTHLLVSLIEEHVKSETFDYSAIQLLASWLGESLTTIPALAVVSEKLPDLVAEVRLTTGYGQFEVWASFEDDGRWALLPEGLMKMIEMTTDSAIQAAGIIISGSADETAATELQHLIAGMPTSSLIGGASVRVASLLGAPMRAVVGLDALSGILSGKEMDRRSLKTLTTTDVPGTDPHLRLALVAAASVPSAGMQINAISTWLDVLWEGLTAEATQTMIGPSAILQPHQLSSVLRLTAPGGTNMSAIPIQRGILQFAIDSTLWTATRGLDMRRDMSTMGIHSVTILLQGFGVPSLPVGTEAVHRLSLSIRSGNLPPWLAASLTNNIGPVLSGDSSTLFGIGRLYLGIARFLIDIYVTNIPIDPAVRRILLGEVLADRHRLLVEELSVVEQAEISVKGVTDSERVKELRVQRELLEQDIAAQEPVSSRESDAGRLATLFSEVYAFLEDIMGETKLAQLDSALRSGQSQAIPREDAFQQATGSFLQRIRANYADLDDLTRPIILAILSAKFGMGCLARQLSLTLAKRSDTLIASLTFPTVAAVSTIILQVNPKGEDVLGQTLVATAAAYETFVHQSESSSTTSSVMYLDGLYASWSAVRLREQEEAADAESLYRVRKTDVEVLSDLEEEEKEFAELFPTYDDVDDQTTKKPISIAEKAKFAMARVLDFHRLVMDSGAKQSGSFAETLLASLIDEVLHEHSDLAAYDESLDHASLAYQVRQLHRRRIEITTPPAHANFYLSSNEPEIRKAHSIVSRVIVRLDALIAEWPEQMVPQHIKDRCERILDLDVQSPVAKILTAIEQLLTHTEDWEAYASRENSLKSYQEEMTNLIIAWRRLELSSWMRLLEDQVEKYVEKDAEWTLRLYGALVHGVSMAEDAEKHLAEVMPMLSQYLQNSTFGHFAPRLAVLECFEITTRRMAAQVGHRQHAYKGMSTMLHNTIANARLFATRITDLLHSQRAAIDKSIKDFVRLASWKDVNVYALKASAIKSHRQLHRSVRKFKEVLQQPVSPILADLHSVVPQDGAQPSALASTGTLEVVRPSIAAITVRSEVALPVPVHIQRLQDIFERYSTVLAKHADRANSHSLAGTALDDMAIEIIESAAALAKETPGTLTKDNKKVVANLASRKRKAYSDLLKALRASGFSANVRADMMAKQQSSTWLASREALTKVDGVEVGKIENYRHRLGVLMGALRRSFNGHNDDIASGDLARGIGFAESLYATALSERDHLASQLVQVSKLTRLIPRLRRCSVNTITVSAGDRYRQAFLNAEHSARQLLDALREVEVGIQHIRDLQNEVVDAGDLTVVHESRQELTIVVEGLALANTSVAGADCPLYTDGETSLLSRFEAARSSVIDQLVGLASNKPDLNHLCIPVADLARSKVVDIPINLDEESSTELWRQSDDLISALLVVVQRLRNDTKSPGTDEDERVHVPTDFKQHREHVASLRISDVITRLDAFVDTLTSGSVTSTSIPACLDRVLPFLETLTNTYTQYIAHQAFAVKSTHKLTYVVALLMLDIAQKGFCKPQEEGDESKGGQDGEMVDGTGLGSGTGDKNVSNEIEEEGQVEGLRGEKEEEKEEGDDKDDEDDDAVSMDDDFEGELCEGKEKDEKEGDSGEESEEEDHDEHVGDVDPLDPGAVDEKFWGDEEKEKDEKEKKDGGDEVMDEQQDQGGEAEMTAKDEEKKGKEDKKDEKKVDEPESAADDQKKDGDQGEQEGEGDEEMEELEDDGEEDNDGEERPAGQDQQEVAVPEGDKLDLPEDLNLDDDVGDDEGPDMDENMELGDDEDAHGDEEDGKGEDAEMASNDDGESGDEDAPDPTGVGEEETNEAEEVVGQERDISASNDQLAQESADFGKGGGGGAEGKDQEEVEEKAEDGGDEAEHNREDEEAEPKGKGSAPQQPQTGPSADQQDAEGPAASAGAPMPADANSQQQSARSLGDIMKDIRRRRDEILAQQERVEGETPKPEASEQAPGQVEYVNDDEQEETQALGPAGEEERQKLADLNILDEEDETGDPGERGMDETEEVERKKPQAREADSTLRPDDTTERRDVEKALTQADIGAGASRPADSGIDEDVDMSGEEASGEQKPDVGDDEENSGVTELSSGTLQTARGEDTWRQYAALTSDLSYALCEQLRLILEPTLATRLQGDFRTGKRLNMRKIIPYIASEYTKDKIWLRRTKPSRREYQVLLSLDDSRSMAESHSVHLAYQTLALVSQALNKLEVGQVAIARFGEGVDILHPFGDGFTDADGAKVMGSFGFDQHRTDVASLVERSLGFLKEARQRPGASNSAPDLWQLQIIISDGVCQDHDRLRTLLRRALEERVMIVFIIVDSLHQSQPTAPATTSTSTRPSILSMQTVEYKNVGGEMQLEMTRYLDTFPFEFYVVLRDVEALPGVLADTLRQWMARVSQSQE